MPRPSGSLALAALLASASACTPPAPATRRPARALEPAEAAPRPVVLTIVGTNDFHGRLRRAPLLGGYLRALRAERARDGAVLLVDAGDLLQGTLASNLSEGASVIAAFDALGYQAVALGNHDFDFGPLGPPPSAPGAAPRSALAARIAEAKFPFLAANLTGAPPGVQASCLVVAAGVRVGLTGGLTRDTPSIVQPEYFAGLEVTPLAAAIEREGRMLRAVGAELVVALAHAGGECARVDDPRDLSSCAADAEVFELARSLPPGLVDVIVAGHTHADVAHFVSGIAIVESGSYARAFSRVDLTLTGGRLEDVRIFPPQQLCPDPEAPTCDAPSYHGVTITPDPAVARSIAPALAAQEARRAEPVGARALAPVTGDRRRESALGNLFADLVRAAAPGADAALMNGGALRASLPAGELTYGAFYDAMPFEDVLTTVRLRGATLRAIIARNVTDDAHGILSLSGVRASARCEGRELRIELRRANGALVRDSDELVVAVSDYLATGGDALFTGLEPLEMTRTDEPLREAMLRVLAAHRRPVAPGELLDAERPRLRLAAPRPLRCAAPPGDGPRDSAPGRQ
ncbi:MAG: bifunctional UDP-sugar hydrolase/5'-nucleotidase [Sorangiineae bacterium]|nr:bifunctional UDP-sugar hydrolase/5'-nucleotidase [Polyangiaceae bacterium]MEB2323899.1 bifunctional UDP-sugar hydrolase/5'-nucleotidase [Sorangiineae bacterium]